MTKSDVRSRIGNMTGAMLVLFMALTWVVAKPDAPIARAAVGDLVFTIELPGVQESQVTCVDQSNNSLLEVEDFESFSVEQGLTTYTSAIGVYESVGSTNFFIEAADEFGGAGGTGFYVATDIGEGYELTLDSATFPNGVGYFGFWWSAGNGNNEVTVNMADGTSQTFSTQSILDAPGLQGSPGVAGGDGHFGDPNNVNLANDNENEVYAFVNIFSTNVNAKITSLVFTEKPGGVGAFESDNHTVCPDILDPDTGSPVPQTGAIIIQKSTDPAGTTEQFNFNHNIPGATTSFQLSDGGVQTFTDVPIGEYEVTEEDPASVGNGYFLSNLTCEDSVSGGVASTTNLGERKATIQLDTGETVTCVFTNIVPQPLRFTIEAPGVQQSQVTSCPDLRTETFDGFSTGSFLNFGSAEILASYQSDTGSNIDIVEQNSFGGADQPNTPTKFISTTQAAYTLTFGTTDYPNGIGYFGFWWSAGDGENVLEVTRNDGTVETFTTQSILDSPALQGSPNPGSGVVDGHFGNPTTNTDTNGFTYTGDNAGEAYAFVNIYAQDDASRIKSIRFIETGPSSFESDNHTVCADLITDQGGTELGGIVIRKATNSDDTSSVFTFSQTVDATGDFTLSKTDEALGNTLNDPKRFSEVSVGSYTVTEILASLPGDYSFDRIECQDGPSNVIDSGPDSINPNTAVINVDQNETVTCTFFNVDTTLAVTLSWFLAEGDGETVDFRWQTATETGTAGFNLLAATEQGKVQLNGELIPSPVIDSLTPTNYGVSLVTDAALFYLQEAGVDGGMTEHGPFELGQEYGEYSVPGGVELSPRIWLPLMVR